MSKTLPLEALQKAARDKGHPGRSMLDKATRTLKNAVAFMQQQTLRGPLLVELQMHLNTLLEEAAFLHGLGHELAFIGDIGVGKSTALCHLADLVERSPDRLPQPLMVASAGRTTLCEVALRPGEGWGLDLEPLPDEAVHELIRDFCADLLTGANEGSAPKQLTQELERAIRNMAGLVGKRGGEAESGPDPAQRLARRAAGLDALVDAIEQKIRLWDRRRREIRVDGFTALREAFRQVNYGRHPEVGLPARIVVTVPGEAFPATPYDLTLIDTKGIDETVMRPDLQARLADPRALLVLCSRFNDAPSAGVRQLAQDLVETGRGEALERRGVLLVLARPHEAMAVVDGSGEPVESEADGYSLKARQIRDALRKAKLPALPVLFYNAHADQPRAILAGLLQQLDALRAYHAGRIEDLAATIQRIMAGHEEAATRAARAAVLRRLGVLLGQHQQLPPRMCQPQMRLLHELLNSHACKVRAATRRRGSWGAIDVGICLKQSAEHDANVRSRGIFDALRVLLDNMAADTDLADAHDLVRELGVKAEEWRAAFRSACGEATDELLGEPLIADGVLWSELIGRWGMGSGYRRDVAGRIAEWFQDAARYDAHFRLESQIELAWRQYVLRPLRELIADDEQDGAPNPATAATVRTHRYG
jgi:hypothetical protein